MISMRGAGAAAILSILSACAAVPGSPSPDELLARIEAAHTRADHEALALHYAGEAASSRATALEHRKMARETFGPGKSRWSMPAHCRRLARSHEARAAELEGMAFAQRQLAARATCGC